MEASTEQKKEAAMPKDDEVAELVRATLKSLRTRIGDVAEIAIVVDVKGSRHVAGNRGAPALLRLFRRAAHQAAGLVLEQQQRVEDDLEVGLADILVGLLREDKDGGAGRGADKPEKTDGSENLAKPVDLGGGGQKVEQQPEQ